MGVLSDFKLCRVLILYWSKRDTQHVRHRIDFTCRYVEFGHEAHQLGSR